MKISKRILEVRKRREERIRLTGTRRAALLLRVSDKKQTKDEEVPIPVQQEDCLKMIASHSDWTVASGPDSNVLVYTEAGVSAFKRSKDDRELLVQAMIDAEEDQFDILVIYKSDRLSRISDEYPVVIKQFANMGVQIWVYETRMPLLIDTQAEKLLRYVEGWQAETESINTRFRVTNAMTRMVKHGQWTGGRVPYGYRQKPVAVESRSFVDAGRRRKKPARGIEIAPEEAQWVQKMFELYVYEDQGGGQVAEVLNNPPYNARKRNGSPWDGPTVLTLIKNPIYGGRPAWRKNTYQTGSRMRLPESEWIISEVLCEELRIVDEALWQKAQEKRLGRLAVVSQGRMTMPKKSFTSDLTFAGVAYCGHCGEPLVAKSYSNRRKLADGTEVVDRYLGYQCRNFKRGAKSLCDGPGKWKRDAFENAVMQTVQDWFGSADLSDVYDRIARALDSENQLQVQGLAELEEEYSALKAQQTYYVNQLNLAIAGKKPQIPQQVSEQQIASITERLEEIEPLRAETAKKAEAMDHKEELVRRALELLPRWSSIIKEAHVSLRRALVKEVIDRVVVTNQRIEVRLNVNLTELTGIVSRAETETAASAETGRSAAFISAHSSVPKESDRGATDL